MEDYIEDAIIVAKGSYITMTREFPEWEVPPLSGNETSSYIYKLIEEYRKYMEISKS